MRPTESAELLDVLHDAPGFTGMGKDYFASVHDEFPVEFDLLVGQSALERPYGQKMLTAAEAYYAAIYPDFASNAYMEANRTAMNLWSLDRVMQGDSASFTECQPDAIKLVGEPFERLQQFVAEALPTPEDVQLARVILTIADLGKSSKVAKRMQELTGQEYADHDRLLIDVLHHPTAVHELTPSFTALSQEDQSKALEILETGFHLPQFMQAENLPYHMVPFQALDPKLQNIGHVVSIFDVAGAAGDSIQNGSVALNALTFSSFEQAVEAIEYRSGQTDDPKQIARDSYDHYLSSLGRHFALDIAYPEDRALARLGRMGRATANSDVLMTELRAVLNNRLGRNTRSLLLDFLNQDGFEPGDHWLEYSPALSNETKKAMAASGIDSETALTVALTTIARLTAEARAQFDFSEAEGPVNFVMGDVVRAAEKNTRLLLNGQVHITRINETEAKIVMAPNNELDISSLRIIEKQEDIILGSGNSMFVGYGGGADPITAAVVARILGQPNASVVSVWGDPNSLPENAVRLSERVFKANPETVQPGMRYFEDLVAFAGLQSYIITQTRPFKHIANELEVIADDMGGADNLIGVDTGGDLLQPPTEGILSSRDHTTFEGLAALANKTKPTADLSIIVAPGIDSPKNALDTLQAADAGRFDLAAFKEEIIDFLNELGLPSASATRYSSTLPTFHGVLSGAQGLYELPMPEHEVLRRKWIPFVIVQQAMRSMIVMSAPVLRQALGL